MKQYLLASGSLFTVITLAWVARLVTATPIDVDGYSVPLWLGVIPIAVAGSLAVWAFRLAGTLPRG